MYNDIKLPEGVLAAELRRRHPGWKDWEIEALVLLEPTVGHGRLAMGGMELDFPRERLKAVVGGPNPSRRLSDFLNKLRDAYALTLGRGHHFGGETYCLDANLVDDRVLLRKWRAANHFPSQVLAALESQITDWGRAGVPGADDFEGVRTTWLDTLTVTLRFARPYFRHPRAVHGYRANRVVFAVKGTELSVEFQDPTKSRRKYTLDLSCPVCPAEWSIGLLEARVKELQSWIGAPAPAASAVDATGRN